MEERPRASVYEKRRTRKGRQASDSSRTWKQKEVGEPAILLDSILSRTSMIGKPDLEAVKRRK